MQIRSGRVFSMAMALLSSHSVLAEEPTQAGDQAAESVTTLEPISVTATPVQDESAYLVVDASVATKTDTPLMLTPMTVQVIPQAILTDLDVTGSDLRIPMSYVGVQNLGMQDSGDYLIFRGFLTTTTLWNGFRMEDATPSINYASGGVWMDNVDRLEVLKGPASVLYGRMEPGGAVDVVTRKPLDEFRGVVYAGAGSWSNYWAGADLGGAIDDDKTLLFRLNAAIETSDSWFKFGDDTRSEGIAPVLEWRITPQTVLSVEGQYRKFSGSSNAQQYMPIDPDNGQSTVVDPRYTLMPGNESRFEQGRTYVALDQRLNSDWSASLKYMHSDADNPEYRNVLAAGGSTFPLGPGATSLWVFEGKNQLTTDAMILDVTGHASLLGIKHTILLGADYYWKDFSQRSGADWMQTIDFLNPTPPAPVALTDTWRLKNDEYSFYAQDQMELPRNWFLLIGGRQQSIDERSVSDMPSMFSPPEDVTYKTNVFLPRAGVLWQASPRLSTYYYYTENVGSSNGLDASGSPIKPEKSRQNEVGVKSSWFDGRLNATGAAFNLTKYNIASADLANPGFNIAVGEVRSTGFELDLQGALTPAWNILANYTHARPYVVKGASGAAALQPQYIVKGQDLPFVSNDSFSAWTSYRFQREALAGLRIGGGFNWYSAPNPVDGASVDTDSYAVASVFAAYEVVLGGQKVGLQLNVNNLFDEEYLVYQADDVSYGGNTLAGNWGEPRQIRVTLRTEF